MAVHVVYVVQTPIGQDGAALSKGTATVQDMMTANTEMRILPDNDSPSSSGNPNIKDYLVAEYALGFKVRSMDNTIIVTDDV